MLTKEQALQDVKARYNKIKDKVQLIYKNGKFGFKYDNLTDMSMNDYGRMCEIGYIISRFGFTQKDIDERELI